MLSVSVIIPAYNEESTIVRLLERVFVSDCVRQVVVVDDASTDGTLALLAEIELGESSVRLLRHGKNRGKGAAIRTALPEVTGEIVIIQDADLEYDPSEYPMLIAPFVDPAVQVVYGSRNLRCNPHSSRLYYWGGRLLSWITNWLYGSRITDEATGFKVFRTSVLRSLQLESDGFEFCPEVTAKLLAKGICIHEVPISYNPRTRSEGKKIRKRDGLYAIWTLLRYRFGNRRR